jgi:hypothetical protein
MNQTAVEFLIDEMQKRLPEFYAHFMMDMDSVYDQAKAMEKEQIETAYQAGDGDAYNLEETKTWAEQYYNETYKQ